ncbi:TolB family protein [Flavivirga eckloniae]|uniref:Flagellar motor protein MotB n=1 Tax=Flavivirga eckloniae TaxID=1803846 RepID=A0A2K9PUQ0_9FLAO|nr:PD40 domain-containing protein [Flavivirga eckloniae]AUP80805.1 hypothetical protein C1H87_19650 [Flavivirga eckloniae]
MKGFICICFSLLSLLSFSQTEKYTVTNLGINNEYPHFGLMRVADQKVIFTTYLLDKKGRLKRFQGNPIVAVFQGNLSNDGAIKNISKIQIDSKQDIPYVTSATMSLDGKQLYVTTRYTYKNSPKGDFNMENFHIKVGEYKEGVGWTNFKVLPFCKPKYSYAHPAISNDGKTLYFTANERGGKETTRGGSDIFKVAILGNNTFSKPKNLGSKVNSYSREMFPYISADNTLYFASNRAGGFGGFDIYKSVLNSNGAFEKAQKLAKPINSNKDDFCLIIDAENKSGYFSSKRPKGKGDDDIYFFTMD